MGEAAASKREGERSQERSFKLHSQLQEGRKEGGKEGRKEEQFCSLHFGLGLPPPIKAIVFEIRIRCSVLVAESARGQFLPRKTINYETFRESRQSGRQAAQAVTARGIYLSVVM